MTRIQVSWLDTLILLSGKTPSLILTSFPSSFLFTLHFSEQLYLSQLSDSLSLDQTPCHCSHNFLCLSIRVGLYGCLPLYLQPQEPCLAHSRCSVIIHLMNKYMNIDLFTMLTLPTGQVNVHLVYPSFSHHGKRVLPSLWPARKGKLQRWCDVVNKLTVTLRLPDYQCVPFCFLEDEIRKDLLFYLIIYPLSIGAWDVLTLNRDYWRGTKTIKWMKIRD